MSRLVNDPRRCGECPACWEVEQVARQVLRQGIPLGGPGTTDADIQLWNSTLERNPCLCPPEAPWAAELMERRGNHCSYFIRYLGRVQPFGVIFFGTHGDLSPLVRKAVATLNRAHARGERQAEVEGARCYVSVAWSEAGIREGGGQVSIHEGRRKLPFRR